jgi:hypothetical protein
LVGLAHHPPALSLLPKYRVGSKVRLIVTYHRLPADLLAEGPSSINFLLHTTLPAEAGQAYDLRHHHSWEVSEDGNGLIRINAPPSAAGFADGRSSSDDPSGTHNRLNKPLLSAQTISLLVNAYFEHLAPLFPVISRSDFAAKQNPSPQIE